MTAKSPYEILTAALDEWFADKVSDKEAAYAALEDLNNRALPVLLEGWILFDLSHLLNGNWVCKIISGTKQITHDGEGKTPREAVMNALEKIR